MKLRINESERMTNELFGFGKKKRNTSKAESDIQTVNFLIDTLKKLNFYEVGNPKKCDFVGKGCPKLCDFEGEKYLNGNTYDIVVDICNLKINAENEDNGKTKKFNFNDIEELALCFYSTHAMKGIFNF